MVWSDHDNWTAPKDSSPYLLGSAAFPLKNYLRKETIEDSAKQLKNEGSLRHLNNTELKETLLSRQASDNK